MYIEYLCVSMQFSSLCMRKIGAVPVGFFPSRGMKCETPVFKPYDQTSNFIQRSANTNTGKHMKQASTGWPRIHIYIERIVYIYIFEYTVQCKHYIVIHTYIYATYIPYSVSPMYSFGHIRILLPTGSHKASRAACGASGAQRNCRVKKRPIFL